MIDDHDDHNDKKFKNRDPNHDHDHYSHSLMTIGNKLRTRPMVINFKTSAITTTNITTIHPISNIIHPSAKHGKVA